MFIREFVAIFIVLGNLTANGQSMSKIEEELRIHLRNINYCAANQKDNSKFSFYDSLAKENEIFRQILLRYTSEYPLTIAYNFDSLRRDGLTIATSKDKKFRIYSWNTRTGGTMQNYDNVFQYASNNKVFSKVIPKKDPEGDPGSFYSDIIAFSADSQNFYLSTKRSIVSSGNFYDCIQAFKIENKRLIDAVHIIKTKVGLSNEVCCELDYMAPVNKDNKRIQGVSIEFDEKSKTIRIPLVLEGGEITEKVIAYKLVGLYFERL
jgi:hypothetical protein